MKVVFNGMFEKRSSGCNCKGRKTDYSFKQTRMFILPSGLTKTFSVGKEEEVSERDGKFLLSYSSKDVNGAYREVFTRVD